MRDLHRHAAAEELEQYSMGVSSAEDVRSIEEHLLTCEQCQEQVQELDAYVRDMRMASQQVRREEIQVNPVKLPGWRFPAWLPAMAAVACGLVLVLLVTLSFVSSSGPVVAVALTALRNDGNGGSAPAGRELVLRPDLTGLAEYSSYQVEIVHQAGRMVRRGTLTRPRTEVTVRHLNAGHYFVRVHLPTGDLVREYGLEIR